MAGKKQEFERCVQSMLGATFGRLLVVSPTDRSPSQKHRYLCRCECGAELKVIGASLRNGESKSCGCLQKEIAKSVNLKHGFGNTRGEKHPLYQTWLSMRNRCNNPGSSDYKYYGGKGVRVCERWGDFCAFVKDMGPRPPGCSLDRINPNGDYEPGNCRWADAVTQSRNRSDKRALPTVVNGTSYKSIRAANAATGVDRRVLRSMQLTEQARYTPG